MHQPLGRAAARRHAEALLGDLGVPDPRQKLRAWPHELSGGLRQRIVIAAALASEPDVLLCDEPTTALDVTVQDQILGLLDEIRVERDVGMVFVTHDLGVVAQVAQRVAVMYAGRFMETGPIGPVFQRPEHPYTDGLLGAMPDVADDVEELTTIPGSLPPVGSPPPGCRFAPRCRYADTACEVIDGALIALPEGRATACIAPERMHEDRH
jgi:oligopeptide/dipeptide ABC transporter ATP-binding protein